MRDNESILADVDDADFKLAFKAALIFTLGQRQPFLSARVNEADLKRCDFSCGTPTGLGRAGAEESEEGRQGTAKIIGERTAAS